MFDKDNSGSIDLNELKDAMKALGIFFSTYKISELMVRIDKDGSGTIDAGEFEGLMASLMQERN